MDLLKILVLLTPVITIAANLTMFFYVVPAFKRTKNRAFLLLGFAALLGTFDTVCDYTIAIDLHKSVASYTAYRTLRKLTYFTNCVLTASGVALLAQAAVNRANSETPSESQPNTSSNPEGSEH